MKNVKENRSVIIACAFIVFLSLWVNNSEIGALKSLRESLESTVINSRLVLSDSKWNPATSDIVILDIDKRSLDTFGHWPWSRDKIQHLTSKLINANAAIIAYDLSFSHQSVNSAKKVYKYYSAQTGRNSNVLKILGRMAKPMNLDERFANLIRNHEVVLGFSFHNRRSRSNGLLPTPLPVKDPVHFRAVRKGANYAGNIPVIQHAARVGGFINLDTGRNGILARTPLVMRYGKHLYPSLALQIARVRLVTQKLGIVASRSDSEKLARIEIDELKVPLEQDGHVIVTFRGPPGTFPIVSAYDLIANTIKPKQFDNKIVIVGSSTGHIRPLIDTHAGKQFMSAEIQANLLYSILNGQLLSRPQWMQTLSNLLLLIVGLALAFVLPMLTRRGIIITTFSLITFWYLFNYALFHALIVTPLSVPVTMIILLALVTYITKHDELRHRLVRSLAFVFRKLRLKSTFIDNMPGFDSSYEETATVIFVDIHNFADISEKLDSSQLNRLLNMVCPPLAQIIEANEGEISQSVGHRIMAVWRSGLADKALNACLSILDAMHGLHERLKQKELPDVRVSIGVNTGKIRFRALSLNVSIVCGHTVDVAAKLGNLTRFYQLPCLVGEQTLKESRSHKFRKIDKVSLDNDETMIAIYEPIAGLDEMNALEFFEQNHFEQALGYLANNDLEGARRKLNYLCRLNPRRYLYQLYLKRLQQAGETEPDTEWSGQLNRRSS